MKPDFISNQIIVIQNDIKLNHLVDTKTHKQNISLFIIYVVLVPGTQIIINFLLFLMSPCIYTNCLCLLLDFTNSSIILPDIVPIYSQYKC